MFMFFQALALAALGFLGGYGGGASAGYVHLQAISPAEGGAIPADGGGTIPGDGGGTIPGDGGGQGGG